MSEGMSSQIFRKVAQSTSHFMGTSKAFIGALAVIIIWGITGPLFHFSDTWQLVINTSTTIVTFLMVFLIQNTQNRDTAALHLKLDEVIHALKGARNTIMAAEQLSDDELEAARLELLAMCELEGCTVPTHHHRHKRRSHVPVETPRR